MTFADLAPGDAVFLDANTFVYHFAPDPLLGPPCHRLLQRVEQGELRGVTSTHVLTETAHRLMTIEASVTFGWSFAGIAARLRKHAAEIQKLTAFRAAIEAVLDSTIEVLTIEPQLTLSAADISRQHGLLSNDALIVAVMQNHGLTHLASHDADFDRVAGVKRFAPQ